MKTINIRLAIGIFTLMQIIFAALYLFGGAAWFLNAQVGFFSSFLIIIGSFFGYKKMVNYKVSMYGNEPDIIDKMEDPYGIWDDEDTPPKENENTKTILAKTAVKNTKTTVKGFFSPYRIASYALFLILFLILIKSGTLALVPFLSGVTCAPLAVAVYEAVQTFLFGSADKSI